MTACGRSGMSCCRNLEELYLTGYQCCDTQRPDMSTVWPTAQTLRILVLDVLQDIKTLVRPAPGLNGPCRQRSAPCCNSSQPKSSQTSAYAVLHAMCIGVSLRWHGGQATQVAWVRKLSG